MTFFARLLSTTLVVVVLLAASAMSFAQDDDAPPPTKTATPVTAPTTEPTAEPEQEFGFTLDEPYIQADLRILSGNVQRPNGMFWHNGNLYAACSGDWTIYEIEAETGSTITYIWGIRNAHTLHAEDDPNGNLVLWVPDFQMNTLVRITRGTTQTIADGFEGPWGIEAIADGYLVTNLLGGSVVLVDTTGNTREIATGFRSPAGIVTDDEAVYVANNGSARRAIEWFPLAEVDDPTLIDTTEENGATQSLVSGLQNPTGLTMGPDGMLYFAYSLGTRGVVGRVDPVMCRENGGCTNDEVEIVLYTDLAAPLAGLAVSPDLKLYTHTIFSPDLYYVDLNPRNRATVSR